MTSLFKVGEHSDRRVACASLHARLWHSLPSTSLLLDDAMQVSQYQLNRIPPLLRNGLFDSAGRNSHTQAPLSKELPLEVEAMSLSTVCLVIQRSVPSVNQQYQSEMR